MQLYIYFMLDYLAYVSRVGRAAPGFSVRRLPREIWAKRRPRETARVKRGRRAEIGRTDLGCEGQQIGTTWWVAFGFLKQTKKKSAPKQKTHPCCALKKPVHKMAW